MKHLLLSAGLVAAMSTFALANEYSTGLAQIDQALKSTTISEEVRIKAQELRDRAEEEQSDGAADAAMASIAQAKEILGLN